MNLSLANSVCILQEVFGYPQFRGPQSAIVEHVTRGGDALVLMPTGGGKSLCYQIPAIARQRAGLWQFRQALDFAPDCSGRGLDDWSL